MQLHSGRSRLVALSAHYPILVFLQMDLKIK